MSQITLEIPDPPTSPKLLAELRRVGDLLAKTLAAADRTEPILLNQKLAAKRLGISDRTLFDWIRAGVVPTVDIDGRTWIRAAALDEAMAAREGR